MKEYTSFTIELSNASESTSQALSNLETTYQSEIEENHKNPISSKDLTEIKSDAIAKAENLFTPEEFERYKNAMNNLPKLESYTSVEDFKAAYTKNLKTLQNTFSNNDAISGIISDHINGLKEPNPITAEALENLKTTSITEADKQPKISQTLKEDYLESLKSLPIDDKKAYKTGIDQLQLKYKNNSILSKNLEGNFKQYNQLEKDSIKDSPQYTALEKAENQAHHLSDALSGYKNDSKERTKDASNLDSSRYDYITIVDAAGKETTIKGLAANALKDHNNINKSKDTEATMDMICVYLEKNYQVKIPPKAKDFLSNKILQQNAYPSLLGSLSANGTSVGVTPRDSEKKLHFDKNNTLVAAEYAQTYDTLDNKQNGTFTVRADLTTEIPKVSVSYKSTTGLKMGLDKEVTTALGKAFKSKKTILQRAQSVAGKARKGAVSLKDFMKSHSIVLNAASYVRKKMNERSNSR